MIRVENEVRVYELKCEEIPLGSKLLRVESHWNSDKMVVLAYGDERLTVLATDLQQAITNATRSNRFG